MSESTSSKSEQNFMPVCKPVLSKPEPFLKLTCGTFKACICPSVFTEIYLIKS